MDDQTDVALGKIEGMIQGFWWILPNLGIGLVVLLLFYLIGTGARAGIGRLLLRRGRPDLAQLLAGFAKWALVGLGLLVFSAIVFPSVKPADILATLGVGSVAIGFAFKDILQNWLAGLLILLRQPFRAGDQIVVGKHEGTVTHIEARATLIKTYDSRLVVIPNSDVYTQAVVVNTAFPVRRSEYDIGIGYGDDVERASRVFLDAVRGIEGIEHDPAPEVIPWELAGSTINLRVRWWTKAQRSDIVHVRGRVILALRRAAGEAGIDLPFPTQVVLLHDQTEETDGDRARQREGWPAGNRPPAPRPIGSVRDDAREEGGQDNGGGERSRPERRREPARTQ